MNSRNEYEESRRLIKLGVILVNITIFPILVSGMAYTSDDSFPSNDATQSFNLNNVLHKPVPVTHVKIKAFFPIFSSS